MTNKHLIGKQVLNLEINSSKNAYAIQRSISEMVWKDLLPELNILFDKIVGDEVVISLDKIELDIGNIDLENGFKNKDEIIDRIIKLLAESINEELKSTPLEKNTLKPRNNNNEQRLKELRGDYSENASENTSQKVEQPLRAHYFNIWLYWLEKGVLPTYTNQPEGNWIELVLETLGTDINAVTILEKRLKKYPIALERLILQHSSKDLKSIVELYTAFSQTKLLEFLKEKELAFGKSENLSEFNDFRKLENKIWKQIFKKVILERKKLNSESLIQELKKLPFVENENENENKEKRNETLMESPQFFKNAGVVLLHPFLSSFFGKLNLLEGTEFKDFHCRSKAVLLLHFLATGKESSSEYEMVLPKFLCEMPVNTPIDHTLLISEKEKEEANNVLNATINHWNALGSISIEGLQEGFLIRDGKLEKEQTGWKLYVEQKTLDILLDQLPWGLGMIKLPWMKEILKVEWR